jgi:hypothetical protein
LFVGHGHRALAAVPEYTATYWSRASDLALFRCHSTVKTSPRARSVLIEAEGAQSRG